MAFPRKLTKNFVETQVNDEILIVDLEGGELFSLSGTGRDVWLAIDGVNSVPDIVDAMLEKYDASPSSVEDDVRSLLDEFIAACLVTDN